MPQHDDLARLERALWALVMKLSAKGLAVDMGRIAGRQLAPASWTLLEYLDGLGPMRVSDIAACLGIDISTVTPRLQALERIGFIERTPDPHDGRASVISLGKVGREALQRIHRARARLLSQALGKEDHDLLPIAIDLLERMAGRLAPQTNEREKAVTVQQTP